MENASRALIMAGGILISLVIISILVIVFNSISGLYAEESSSLEVEQLEEYNRKFATYNSTSGLYGTELLSLANFAKEYNIQLADSLGYTSTAAAEDAKSTYYNENKIELEVVIVNIVGSTLKDNSGNTISSVQSQMLKEYLGGKISGTYSVEQLIAFNTELMSLSKTSSDAKSALTELRSLPFRCDTTKTTYNEYGRIKYMYFVQDS